MAELVFTDAFVSIDGNDLSDHVKSVSIEYSADMQEITAMGDDTHTMLGGLKNWSMSVEFNQDYAAASVDAVLFPLVGTSFTVIVRPVASTAVGATNPNYTGTGLLESYNPIAASVGEVGAASVSIQPGSTLNRATS